jgi:hypothetical protein
MPNKLTEASLSSATAWLLLILFLAFALRVGVFFWSPALVHPDEVFQTLEPAHRLAYGFGVTTWEWRAGIRSWVFPGILAGVMRATAWMGPGSAGYLSAIAILLALLSLTTVWFAFRWADRTGGISAAIIAAFACTTWYELVYFAPRPLTEVVATHLLLPGLFLGVFGDRMPERRRLFLAGLFCGSAVALRIQFAPAVAFAVLYFCRSNWRSRLPAVAGGILLPIAVFGLTDAFTWSYPFQSFVRYVWSNVVERKSEFYGTKPWYWYLEILASHYGPILLLALVGLRRSAFLGWIALIILASHSVLAHKEIRFLYPIVPILITLAALGIVEVARMLESFRRKPISAPAVVAVSLALFAIASGARAALAASRDYWTLHSGGLITLNRLSREPAVCGVGLYEVPWFETGAYAHLHQPVPIVLIPKGAQFQEQAASFNFALTGGTLANPPNDFTLQKCWNGVCLYHRPGSCVPPRENEINAALRQKKE